MVYKSIQPASSMPDFRQIITSTTIEEKGEVMANQHWKSFKYGHYKVLAHKCNDRHVWEVHIHEGSRHLLSFTIPTL